MDRQIGRPAFEAEELLARVGDDQGLLRDIHALLAEDAPPRLAELHTAIAASDPRRVGAAAHYLKGAASNFAATRAMALAERLEQLAEDPDRQTLAQTLAQPLAQPLTQTLAVAARDLEAEFVRLLADLDAFLGNEV